MTTIMRHPFTTRHPDPSEKLMATSRVQALQTISSNKRPRSPGVDDTIFAAKIKRAKSGSSQPLTTAIPHTINTREIKERKEKLRQKEERQQAKEEFVTKYTKAFPSFVFYFDDRDEGIRQLAESRVLALGARIEHFFSSAVTHVITNQPQPPKNEQYDPANKENIVQRNTGMNGSILKSPIQLKGRAHDHGGYDKLVRDAVQLDKKIWSLCKLDNILSRLVPSASNLSKAKTSQRSPPLTQLLQHERLHGTTSERDPRERRHDFEYFAKGSYFLLVEDIWGELAPIAIMEYSGHGRPVEKEKAPTYPVLYMDPRARSPFVKYDEREARKLEKVEANEKFKEMERKKHRAKIKELLKRQHEEMRKREKSLRRCASMGDLDKRAVTHTEFKDFGSEASDGGAGLCGVKLQKEQDACHQQVASGFGPSTTGPATGHSYIAASGNSVAITSTTTTSFAQTLGNTRLPPNLREQLARQVITSRRGAAAGKEKINSFEARLRKAKSTTTMRLPTREESKKPGYCEACRVKFEDFAEHIRGSRHQKFAQNESNYIDLDFLLARLQRKSKMRKGFDQAPQDGDVELQDSSPSDACLGPGDYFYLSPEQELEAEVEEDSQEIEDKCVPKIIIDEDDSEVRHPMIIL